MEKNEAEKPSLSVKAILVGNSGVGKTSIITRLNSKTFTDTIESTVCAAYYTKEMQFDDRTITLRIWDTAGQEVYKSLTNVFFRDSMIVFVVFDVTDQKSFFNVPDWIQQARSLASPNAAIVIVGNKVDLVEKRLITPTEIEELAESNDAISTETSAKSGLGVEKMFQSGLAELISKNEDVFNDANAKLKSAQERSTGCC